MNTKLQELTDKIYLEGVEKGKAEAKRILDQARSEADQLLENAKAEAAQLIKAAENKSAELDKNTKSELQLFARQSVNALKTEITDMICGQIVAESVKSASSDKEFMQKIILAFVQDWAKNESVTIGTADAEKLTKYFTANAKSLLEKGFKIEQANGVKAGFSVEPASGGYKITFGDDEFIAYFKEFLRPRLVEMLF